MASSEQETVIIVNKISPSPSTSSGSTIMTTDSGVGSIITGVCHEDVKKQSVEKQNSIKNAAHQTNYVQTLMHLLNGFIGSGILSMPITFKNGGLILSSIMNPLIGLLSCHCIHMIVQINELAMKTKQSTKPFEYHELAEFAFSNGPARLKSWAKIARYYVLSAVVSAQIGGCCVYFLFIATNTEKLFINMVGREQSPSKEACLTMILPVVILINYIRNIRKLTILSSVANILQVGGLVIIFRYLLSTEWPEFPDQLPATGDKIPQFFVSSLFIFEGISVSMSLYKAIDEPKKFSRPLGVLNVGLFLIGSFYFALGFMGYGRFGSNVQATITVNLPASILYDSVQIMYAIAVLFTYPIILFVPIQILWPILKRKLFKNILDEESCQSTGNSKKILITELLFRAGLVFLTYILATVIPKLELIISLVGAITSSSIAVIIPSTLNMITFCFAEHQTLTKRRRIFLLSKNLLIMFVGWLGFILGAYYSICDIIASYQTGTIEIDDDVM